MIINTEDGEGDSYYDEEVDPYEHPGGFGGYHPNIQYYQNLPPYARLPIEQDYMLHSEDIIDEEEEELEESCDEQKLKSLKKLSARKQQKMDRAGSMLNQDIVGLPKVTPEELLEFAVVRHPTQSSNEELKGQYEV